jgi:DNA-binding response OmpR family regulator
MSRRVLVIEDDRPIAVVLERGLGLAGYTVELADDGPSGLARWAEGGWSVVVLDMMLPGMDGVTMCATRRAQGDMTPVMLLTARDDETLREAARVAGADAFLTKPFVYADLLAMYPEPRTVWMSDGSFGTSTLLRRYRTYTSTTFDCGSKS